MTARSPSLEFDVSQLKELPKADIVYGRMFSEYCETGPLRMQPTVQVECDRAAAADANRQPA